jgi:hypothetical protein
VANVSSDSHLTKTLCVISIPKHLITAMIALLPVGFRFFSSIVLNMYSFHISPIVDSRRSLELNIPIRSGQFHHEMPGRKSSITTIVKFYPGTSHDLAEISPSRRSAPSLTFKILRKWSHFVPYRYKNYCRPIPSGLGRICEGNSLLPNYTASNMAT